ncbi:MAG TPA: translocation protein TolB [Cytophagales bacterium]|nr:translocation protein TolB [Cytophagales bacterium]
MSINTRAIILFILTIYIPGLLSAQSPVTEFGKNRIQYKPFDWSYVSTQNYDIYYYKDGYENARLAAEIAEEDFDKITDIIGYSPYTKTKIFLYNSVSDLQQSNIGINDQNYKGGGQTNFFKSQIEMAYPGTLSSFKDELSYNVARMLITDMMFGGNLKDMLQNSFLLTLPDWFMEGAALYVSQGWGLEMDDLIRDKLIRGKIKRLNTLKGDEAGIVGQSIWNYIAEKYGRINISNVLNLTRIIRNEESSISSTLGISFNRFVNDWRNYYITLNEPVIGAYADPSADLKVRKKNKKGFNYNKVKINSTGEYVAYSENFKGKFKVYVKRINSKRRKVALKGGHKVINQAVDQNLPLLSWKDDRYLGIISVKKGKTFFWLYDINRGKKSKREIKILNQILDFDFSDDGNTIVLSASQGGQTDLFFMNVSNGAIHQITRDVFDDINPVFIPGTESIAFASNRISDTLSTSKVKPLKTDENFNIFIYSPDTSKRVLKRVSNTISKEIKPIGINTNEILYLSDQKGIFNIYKYRIDQNVFNQISNNMPSIRNYDVNVEKGILAYTTYFEGAEHLFILKDFNFDQNNFTRPTPRQEIMQARALSEKRLAKQEAQQEIIKKDTLPAIEYIKPDSLDLISLDSLVFQGEMISPNNSADPKQDSLDNTVAQAQQPDPESPVTDEIDTDDYQFESSPKKPVKSDTVRRSILRTYAAKKPKIVKIQGPFPYQNRFSADNVVSTFQVDPLRGWGIQLEMAMNDMLENHLFHGGVLMFLDLRSSNFFAEYKFLKYRVDFDLRVDRKSYFFIRDSEITQQKYSLNKIELGMSYPFSLTSRFSVHPFFAHTRYNAIDAISIQGASVPPGEKTFNSTNYGGFRAEFVFDNSLIGGLNIIEGTRIKAGFENYTGIYNEKGEERGFNNFHIDIRRYQKIHKEIVLAARVFYGNFFGKEKQDYILGGMINSVFERTPKDEPLNYYQRKENYSALFSEFVTPLRGFNFNTMHGSQVLSANVELRFPVVTYFYNGPISSNFFRNLQLVGFFDIGSAWDGEPPFSNDNTINTETVKNGPFDITVKGFSNPWLSGYGAGLRTMLFGYFAKFDVGWGVENYVVKKPKLHLTVGHDF